MKIDSIADKVIIHSHDFASKSCTIDAEDMKYIASLLRNNYSDTVLATIREIYANAIDANVVAGKDASSIIVTLPTKFSPTFSVRDFGFGISEEQMFELYTKYGKSTKRDTNSAIGAFGIGRFAPLAYNKDGFSVTSFVNGQKTVYFIYISEDNDTKVDRIFSGETCEENGVLIEVCVAASDIDTFLSKSSRFFSNFDVLPNIKNLSRPIVKREIVLSGTDWEIQKDSSHHEYIQACAIIGGICYPIDVNLIRFDSDTLWMRDLYGLRINIPIGSVKIHHSRESLEYNKFTQTALREFYSKISKEIEEKVAEFFQEIDCYRSAKIKFNELKNLFPGDIFEIFKKKNLFKFKDVIISDGAFNKRDYVVNDNFKRIPIVSRSFYLSSDGNSVSHAKNYSYLAKSDTAYVFNDLPQGEKIVNRIFTLFKFYKMVIVFYHDYSEADKNKVNGIEVFKQENRFDLVKTGVYNLSQLSPVKLQTKKTVRYSVSPNYVFTVNRSGLCASNKDIVNNDLVIKPYLECKDKKPLNTSHEIRDYSIIKDLIFSGFLTHFCFVSTAISTSKKFSENKSFVKLEDFFKAIWEKYSQEDKDLFISYCAYGSEIHDSYLMSYFCNCEKYNSFCKDLSLFMKEKENVEKLVASKKMTKQFDCLYKVINMSNFADSIIDKTLVNKNTKEILDKVKNLYPLYTYFSSRFGEGKNSQNFCEYATLENFRRNSLTK